MYRGLLRKERRRLHGEVAAAIERVYPARLVELSPSLARHHAEAGDSDKAVSYYFLVARQAQERGARVEAARFFEHVHALLRVDPEADSKALVDSVLGRLTAGMAFVPGQEAIGVIESIFPVAEELDDPDRLARLYERLIWTRSLLGGDVCQPRLPEGTGCRVRTGFSSQ